MAEHWIDAATARRLVMTSPHDFKAVRSLCSRANSGLIMTTARLFVVTRSKVDKRIKNVNVPARFWWARGHEALEQDWASGDFSTWVSPHEQWRAFGVTFALSGVLEMLPHDQRAQVARGLSVAGNPAWVTARAARQFACERAGISDPTLATTAILDQARLGFVTARAVLAQGGDASKPTHPTWEEREWAIPDWFWRDFTIEGRSSQTWERGIFIGVGTGPNEPCSLTLTGVHFLAESLAVLLPASDEGKVSVDDTPGEERPKTNRGGRPPAEWWDDLWCAVWGQIYDGKLIPRSQAEVEEAMHLWASEHGHSPADSTVRLRAKKLFNTISS